jgi:hypothetical protein
MLIVNGPEGSWGLLADEVKALATLETSATAETGFEDVWSEAVAGWSAYQSQVVRVLDPSRFYRAAQRALEQWWDTRLGAPDVDSERTEAPTARKQLNNVIAAGSEKSNLESVRINPQLVSG